MKYFMGLLLLFHFPAFGSFYSNKIDLDKYLLAKVENNDLQFQVSHLEPLLIISKLTHQDLFPTIKMPQKVSATFDAKLVCKFPIKIEFPNHELYGNEHKFKVFGNILYKVEFQSKNSCFFTLRHHHIKNEIKINFTAENEEANWNLYFKKEVQSVEILDDSVEGLNAKIKTLLGRKLTQSEIKNQNPYIEFSEELLPEYDKIYLATLVYKNDFYGNLIARLLKLHAKRGADIKIIVTNALLKKQNREKDRILLRDLELSSSRIKVLRYSYPSSFDGLHRAIHAKTLVALSKNQVNISILGGRNIADEFVFTVVPDYGSFPALTQYSLKEDRFAPFTDLEYLVESDQVAISLAQKIECLFDAKYCLSISKQLNDGIVFSIPFMDNKILLKRYLDAIQLAEKEILIVTPYFLPHPEIQQALMQKALRGVEIKVVTQMVLKNDDFPKIMENVNKISMHRFKDKMKIYSWKDPKTIIHSKLMIIDEKIAVGGSVNFDQRGLIHDIEASIFIDEQSTVLKLRDVYKSYLLNSDPVKSLPPVNPIVRKLIESVEEYF